VRGHDPRGAQPGDGSQRGGDHRHAGEVVHRDLHAGDERHVGVAHRLQRLDRAAASRPVDEPHERQAQIVRHPLGVDHLLPDRGVGSAAADREVVALHHGGAPVDLPLAEDHVGRQEGLELAAGVVGGSARERARLVEGAAIEERVDALADRPPAGGVLARDALLAAHLARQRLAPAQLLELWFPGHRGGTFPSMWTTWSGGESCAPLRIERPRSRTGVIAALDRAAAAGVPVRVAGAGHSFSPAACTDGILLCLDALDRVLDADPESGLVHVEAGIRLRRLNEELLARGLALANLGDIDAQSLAGALATATHGTGGELPNLSAAVEEMDLVLADGSQRTLTRADSDLLRAARVGLGALGVVVAVTLRCVPAFRLHAVDEPMPLHRVLDELEDRVAGAEHFELWTFPHSNVAITRTNRRTDFPARPPGRARTWVEEILLENHALSALNRVGRRAPGAIPSLNRLAGALASRRERVDESFEIFASERRVRFEETEVAVPRERAREGLEACREILARHPVGFPVELRFTAADDALLSPSHGRPTAYLAAHVFRGVPFTGPLGEVESALLAMDGRPHWGKRSWAGAAGLAGRYPRWDAFAAARAELDPGGRFASAWTERVLGPVRERVAL